MTAKELLKPRFEVIADYPCSILDIGEVFMTYETGMVYATENDKISALDYPHLFRKIDWWEHRKEEDMPKKLKSLASKDNVDFDLEKEEVFHIIEWDMNGMMGFLNIEKREVCDLEIFSPEYGYIPVD